jgi:hypothetical protein
MRIRNPALYRTMTLYRTSDDPEYLAELLLLVVVDDL